MNSVVSLVAALTVLGSVNAQYGYGYYGPYGQFGPYGQYGPSGRVGSMGIRPPVGQVGVGGSSSWSEGGDLGEQTGPYDTALYPSWSNLADSFMYKIERRMQNTLISNTQRMDANNILRDAKEHFKDCGNDFPVYPITHQYKSCLLMHFRVAMEKLRALETVNRPYQYGTSFPNYYRFGVDTPNPVSTGTPLREDRTEKQQFDDDN